MQGKHSLAYLQDLIPALADTKYLCKHTSLGISYVNLVDVLENALAVCICLHVFELTV